MTIKFNDQSERRLKSWDGFLVAQTTVKRHEIKSKKKKRSTNKQS